MKTRLILTSLLSAAAAASLLLITTNRTSAQPTQTEPALPMVTNSDGMMMDKDDAYIVVKDKLICIRRHSWYGTDTPAAAVLDLSKMVWVEPTREKP